MPTRNIIAAALLIGGFTTALTTLAEERVHEKVVIAVRTDDAELIEADVSDLQPGESDTFVTGSGRIVDVLRTTEGVELYIDGELVNTGAGGDLEARIARIHERIEFECAAESDVDCEDLHAHAYAYSTGDGHADLAVDGDSDLHDVIVIREEHSVVTED